MQGVWLYEAEGQQPAGGVAEAAASCRGCDNMRDSSLQGVWLYDGQQCAGCVAEGQCAS